MFESFPLPGNVALAAPTQQPTTTHQKPGSEGEAKIDYEACDTLKLKLLIPSSLSGVSNATSLQMLGGRGSWASMLLYMPTAVEPYISCLLYTSDAADDTPC
eukprot:1699526-Amphidinium_carterae.1